MIHTEFPDGSVLKNLPANAGQARDASSVPGLGRSPGEGNSNHLWYSCLENPMGRGAQAWLSDWTTTIYPQHGMNHIDIMLTERSQKQREHAVELNWYEVQEEAWLTDAQKSTSRGADWDRAWGKVLGFWKCLYVVMTVIQCMCVCSVTQSCLTLCHPMDYSQPGSSVHGIFRQEYWSRLPFPPPGDLPNPGTEPMSPASPALAGRFFTTEPPGKPPYKYIHI